MNIKDIVKDNIVTFSHYKDGILYYTVPVKYELETLPVQIKYNTFQFPVPANDAEGATLLKQDKAMLFMRYIRKALNEGTFLQVTK